MSRHIVTFAKTSVAIDYPPGELSELIEFLYRDVASDPGIPTSDALRITRQAGPAAEWHILHENTPVATAGSVEALAAPLIEETLRRIVDHNRSGLAIHAAALSQRGSGVLLPGPSGTGKSSLATWLTAHGFNYLGDELAVVEPDHTLDAFTRPIKLKTTGLAALRALIDVHRSEAGILFNGTTIMVPPQLLNPENARESPTLGLLVFPHYREQTRLTLTPISPAQAGLVLMECLVNARNLAEHGFGAVAALVREVPAFRLEYGGFEQLDALLGWFRSA
ncbi:MAG: hypothetical protein OEQ18_05675, partial [Gammaproteobacteria bacterium]|nr:hypothetical protein [Gammaproteobacteria bacterium]